MRSSGGATVAGSGGNGSVSRVTVRKTVDVLPAASVATTVMTFAPSARATVVEKAPVWSSDTGSPLTVTPNAVASVAVPITSTVADVVLELSVGAVTVSDGAVLSRVTVRTIVDVCPSASVATNEIWLTPGESGTMSSKNPSPVSACGSPFAVTVTAVRSETGPRVNSLDCCVTRSGVG